MGNRLYVGNLDSHTNAEDLTLLFSGAGVVARAEVIIDRDTGRSKGFGFVKMDDDAGARQAIEMYNGHILNNRPLKVNYARERDEAPVPPSGNRPAKPMPRFKEIKHKSRGGAFKRRY